MEIHSARTSASRERRAAGEASLLNGVHPLLLPVSTYVGFRILFATLTNFIRQNSSVFRSQTLNGPFSSVSKPIFATKYAFESAWRELQIPRSSRDLNFQNFSFLIFVTQVQLFSEIREESDE